MLTAAPLCGRRSVLVGAGEQPGSRCQWTRSPPHSCVCSIGCSAPRSTCSCAPRPRPRRAVGRPTRPLPATRAPRPSPPPTARSSPANTARPSRNTYSPTRSPRSSLSSSIRSGMDSDNHVESILFCFCAISQLRTRIFLSFTQLCGLARNCGLVERLLPEHQVFSGSRHGGSGRLRVRVPVANLCGLPVARRSRGSRAAVLRANIQRRRTEDAVAHLGSSRDLTSRARVQPKSPVPVHASLVNLSPAQ